MSDPQPPLREREPACLYVLICWRDGPSVEEWRFTLVDGRTETRRSFRDLAALTAFLDTTLAPDRVHL